MRSMTGFGMYSSKLDGKIVTVEIRSENNRFIKIDVSLPWQAEKVVARLKNLVEKHVNRGTIFVKIYFNDEDGKSYFDIAKIENCLNRVAEVGKKLKVSGQFTLSDLIRLIEYTTRYSPTIKLDAGGDALYGIVAQAIIKWKISCDVEGAKICKVVSKHTNILSKLHNNLKKKESLMPFYLKKRLEKLLIGMKTSGVEIKTDKDTVARELGLILSKSDISEEVDRLGMHIGRLNKLILTRNEAVGKDMDFVLQEILRETNTVLSKSADKSITSTAMLIKSNIEKIKEMAQNIE
jgi:uncharacterized protein (TIGR00255 family)